MKIDGKLTSSFTGEVASEGKTARPAASPARAGSPAAGTDVRVSALAAQLQALESNLLAGDSVDAAKVAGIRQAIAEGRLQINPDVIADRLLETVRELIRDHGKP